jgi:hypothetical protein
VNLNDYRALFLVVVSGLALVAVSPIIGVVLPESGSERFSEFYILGPDHMAEGYPFNVQSGEMYNVFLGVENHMGGSKYYRVSVKFSNGTEFLPDLDNGVSSSLPPLYEYRFFVGDGGVWESAVSFGFEDVVVDGDVLSVGTVVFDGVSFPVDISAVWDSEKDGHFFVLFFELWHYDPEYDGFRFDDRFVGLWLNMNIS